MADRQTDVTQRQALRWLVAKYQELEHRVDALEASESARAMAYDTANINMEPQEDDDDRLDDLLDTLFDPNAREN